ncbi:hypothetical protein N7490_001648 [Penicillium lividum]|nr:hypothetical protein N7490_001648 [Penicillium lividum]
MQDILKHFLPNTDLTPEKLRALALKYNKPDASPIAVPASPASLSPFVPYSLPNSGEENIDDHIPEEFRPDPQVESEDIILRDVFQLHQQFGCLLADSQGEFRYMGAESGLPFNAIIRCFKSEGFQIPTTPDVIAGMVTVNMPLPDQKSQGNLSLPPQDICQRQVMRYFEEVHCLYWLYSPERFHIQLEETYRDPQQNTKASWRCSLYSILAVSSLERPEENEMDSHSPTEFLEHAKSLVSAATATQSHGFSNPAYLYTSLAVQIACSLGIHRDKYCAAYGLVEKEHARRVWWSVVVFDQDLSQRLGKPSATSDSWETCLPSELILSAGAYTPSGYLAACGSLSQLAKAVRKGLYSGSFVQMKTLQSTIKSLSNWEVSLPPHLRLSVPTAPLLRRPISILHLRYHGIQLLVGRPVILYQLLCQKNQRGPPESSFLNEITALSLSSAEQMLEILERMVLENFDSKIIALDFYYALDILQIFLSVFALTKAEKQLQNISQCMKVLQAIGSAGFGEKIISEVLFQLMEWALDAVTEFHERQVF